VPLREALPIAIGITRGLAAAHARGIAHRDLTPRNVMLAEHDRVKILDFGLARAAGAGAAAAGTPAYMAPEQVRGEPAGLAADVWSLGVTLFQLLTGRRPFARDGVETTLDAVLTAEPPPARSLNPRVPEPLERLLQRMLAKDPAARPPDAAAVRAALEPIVARYLTRRSRLLTAGVVGALAVVAVGGFATRRPVAPPGIVPDVRIVVLPIDADKGSPDAVYLAGGLHERISGELSRIRGLAVISWSRGRPGENTPEARRRLARALSAAAVIEGRVDRQESMTLHVRAADDRVLRTIARDYAGKDAEGDTRAVAVEIARALGVPLVADRAELRHRGALVTDPRTGHVYEAVPVTLDWFEAVEAAAQRTHEGRRGHLVAITSAAEDDFIRAHLPEAVLGHYWLGAYRAVRGLAPEEGWRWITGEPFGYAPWFRGRPNDYFGEDGLQYYGTLDSTTWNDIDRTSGFEPFVGGFIVEYEPGPARPELRPAAP
ncbi:MAG TPA: protein kinase, partial [Gemmatimonadales bacterium]|nr:protein kinase [Gemmatimonadales bacterium]